MAVIKKNEYVIENRNRPVRTPQPNTIQKCLSVIT